MSEVLLSAIYETKRQQLLLAKIDPGTRDAVPDALALAYYYRICPIFHLGDRPDPFETAYAVPKTFVEKILDYCDKKWRAKEPVTFYELEDEFGKERMEIFAILKYTRLDGGFDDDFYRSILSDCPAEAHGIERPFEPEDISIS